MSKFDKIIRAAAERADQDHHGAGEALTALIDRAARDEPAPGDDPALVLDLVRKNAMTFLGLRERIARRRIDLGLEIAPEIEESEEIGESQESEEPEPETAAE